MKKVHLLSIWFAFIVFTISCSSLFGQSQSYQLFEDITLRIPAQRHQDFIVNQRYLDVSSKGLSTIQKNKPEKLVLPLPASLKLGELELTRTNVFAGGYLLKDQNGRPYQSNNDYSFYRGNIKEDDKSLVIVSFINDEVKILISVNGQNYRIHQLKDQPYVFFKDADMKNAVDGECMTEDESAGVNNTPQGLTRNRSSLSGNCVEIFFECDYDSYVENGSNLANTEAWMAGVFNEVKTLYNNEGIPISISEIKVWTASDPYAGINSTSGILNAWGSDISSTGFNGRLAHFVSTRGIGGGIAWVNVLCSNTLNFAVSGSLSATINPFPNYSWNVNVIAHEIGHNFGSSHTHACVWNGNNTQIDDCGATYSNPLPDCYDPNNPLIPPSGTIMSYCHLGTGNGIDFALGFGPQPGALILNKYQTASCNTGNCSPPSCVTMVAPIPSSSNVSIEANLAWDNDVAANGYFLTVGTSPTNGSIVNNFDVGSNTSFDPGSLPFGATIYVKIIPYNNVGNATGCNNYTFTTEPNTPPSCISLSHPVNGSLNVNTDVIFTWPDAPGFQTGYKVRIGTTPGGSQILNNFDVGNVQQFQPGNLATLTTYYVVITPYGTNGDAQGCNATSFTTNDTSPYCESQGTDTGFEWIESLTIGDLQNVSGNNGGYVDFTNLVFNASQGQTYPVHLVPGFNFESYEEFFRIWIDFNGDGDFTDNGELVFDSGEVTTSVSGAISIPSGISDGLSRMRVSMRFSAPSSSCQTFQYGEVEDYSVQFGTNTPCNVVTNTNESGPGSFMNAIDCASEGDTISFDNSLSGSIIELTNSFAVINQDVVIRVEDGANITVCGTGTATVFSVDATATLHLIGLEILSGTSMIGGGIQNNGAVILEDVLLKHGPTAPANAYLIDNNGVLNISGNTLILEN